MASAEVLDGDLAVIHVCVYIIHFMSKIANLSPLPSAGKSTTIKKKKKKKKQNLEIPDKYYS